MRALILAVVLLSAGCGRSPEQQQIDQVRSDAQGRAAQIENQAEAEADKMDRQATALSERAKQAGGFTGKRLDVQADALTKEAELIRQQAASQASAITEGAEARIKAFKSR